MQGRFAASNQRSLKDGVKGKKLSAGLERMTDVLVGIGTALVLAFGAFRVMIAAEATAPHAGQMAGPQGPVLRGPAPPVARDLPSRLRA